MGVRCLGIRRCFEFVISERLGSGQQDDDPAVELKRLLSEELSESPAVGEEGEGALGPGTKSTGADATPSTSNVQSSSSNKAHEDSVFMQSYIPRSLNEVYDPERDVEAVLRGERKQLIYADSIGLVDSSASALTNAVSSPSSRPDPKRSEEKKTSKVRFGGEVPGGSDEGEGTSEGTSGDEDEEGEEASESEDEDGDETKPFEERRPRGHRHEDREEKKVRNPIYLMLLRTSPVFELSRSFVRSLADGIFTAFHVHRRERKPSKRRRRRNGNIRCLKRRRRRK